jgi:transglutaminase-like putative cysteine protease
MLYDIRLTIEYRYPAASDHVRNILRVHPLQDAHQRVLQQRLMVQPSPDEWREGRDFFGNTTTTLAWHRPVTELEFALHATAERLSVPEFDLSAGLDRLADQAAAQGLGPRSPLHFRPASPRIAPSREITAFARQALPDVRLGSRAAVERVGQALHGHMIFDATATDATTAPEAAFRAGRGVCQDFAQIMVAGLRGLGIPAAYVSGFLRTNPPPGKPRMEGADAMHAWVAAWCGAEQGWVEYDPTNRQWAGQDHIRAAIGRDYGDAAPVRGAIRTAGATETRHRVDVIALRDNAGLAPGPRGVAGRGDIGAQGAPQRGPKVRP